MKPQNIIRAHRRHEHRKEVSPETGAQLSLDALGVVPVAWEPYDIPAPRHLQLLPPSVPVDTSEHAAQKIRGATAQMRQRVLDALTRCGAFGATERELEEMLAMRGNSLRPRLWELEGNAPEGRPKPPVLVKKTPTVRRGARVYVAL